MWEYIILICICIASDSKSCLINQEYIVLSIIDEGDVIETFQIHMNLFKLIKHLSLRTTWNLSTRLDLEANVTN